jgi:hypothetical protein
VLSMCRTYDTEESCCTKSSIGRGWFAFVLTENRNERSKAQVGPDRICTHRVHGNGMHTLEARFVGMLGKNNYGPPVKIPFHFLRVKQ